LLNKTSDIPILEKKLLRHQFMASFRGFLRRAAAAAAAATVAGTATVAGAVAA